MKTCEYRSRICNTSSSASACMHKALMVSWPSPITQLLHQGNRPTLSLPLCQGHGITALQGGTCTQLHPGHICWQHLSHLQSVPGRLDLAIGDTRQKQMIGMSFSNGQELPESLKR